MLLRVIHKTDLTYSDYISESVMELRMAPRQELDQHRLSFNLAIGPPTSATSYFDWLGNTVHAFTVNAFHQQVQIIATSVVETNRPKIDLRALPDVWPLGGDFDYTIYDFLQFDGPVVDSPLLRELLGTFHFHAGDPLGDMLLRLLDFINGQFTYEQGITTSASPITECLQHRRGVCQDFTHLMIGLCRALRIPTRYVSGFLHPQGQRLRGYTETHAWCEILFPSTGWIGLDPTNCMIANDHMVKVAIGRDYRDVPPNKGIYRGNAIEKIRVEVKSEELTSIPPELAAERFQSLAVPTYPAGFSAHREQANQQQEQQQQ